MPRRKLRDMAPKERDRYLGSREDRLREAQDRREADEKPTRKLTRLRRQMRPGQRDGEYMTK